MEIAADVRKVYTDRLEGKEPDKAVGYAAGAVGAEESQEVAASQSAEGSAQEASSSSSSSSDSDSEPPAQKEPAKEPEKKPEQTAKQSGMKNVFDGLTRKIESVPQEKEGGQARNNVKMNIYKKLQQCIEGKLDIPTIDGKEQTPFWCILRNDMEKQQYQQPQQLSLPLSQSRNLWQKGRPQPRHSMKLELSLGRVVMAISLPSHGLLHALHPGRRQKFLKRQPTSR